MGTLAYGDSEIRTLAKDLEIGKSVAEIKSRPGAAPKVVEAAGDVEAALR